MTVDGSVSLNLAPYFTKSFGLFLVGALGGGTLVLHAGDADNVAPVQVLNPYDGTWTPYAFGSGGIYGFEMAVDRIDFVLAGSTGAFVVPIVMLGYRR
jgi:hypothetical protein